MKVFLTALVVVLTVSAHADESLVLQLGDALCKPPKNVVEGAYLGEAADYARDVWCARRVLRRSAPDGFVTIFGSARLGDTHEQYRRMLRFAQTWSRKHPEIPIMTGGGPGLMEAANKGAMTAGGRSLGFSTRFGQHGVEKPNAYMTDHLEFSDFALRESWLINPARAIVVGSGGMGTAWEVFEAMAKKQTGKIGGIPLVFLGTREEWLALQKVLDVMASGGVIGPKDKGVLVFADSADQAVAVIERSFAETAKAGKHKAE